MFLFMNYDSLYIIMVDAYESVFFSESDFKW